MQEPDRVDIEVFVGVDITKGDHYACAVTATGSEVLRRSVRDDEAVIDTTSSSAALLLETAERREVPVTYVSGLAMRRRPVRRRGQGRRQRRPGARRLRRPPDLDGAQ